MDHDETIVYRAVEKLTPVLWRRTRKDGQGAYYLHWCQGCGHAHTYPVGKAYSTNWKFNDNIQSPSFEPSMLIYMPEHTDSDGVLHRQRTRCHYYVTNGEIRYQGDCPHQYSGQNLPLQPIPENYGF